MFRNYFLVTLRNMARNKGFSFINICGLAVGMACCLLIYLFVQDDLSIDGFHENGDNIYRVTTNLTRNGEVWPIALTQASSAGYLKADYPEIAEATFLNYRNRALVSYGEKSFLEKSFCYADPAFFRMFSYQFLHGDPATALDDPNSLVISESIAAKYFQDENPLGKILEFKDYGSFRVSGVLASGQQSHLSFEIVLSTAAHKIFGLNLDESQAFDFSTYLLLHPTTNAVDLQAKINADLQREHPEAQVSLSLQPVKNIYLHSGHLSYDIHPRHGNIDLLYTLMLVSAFILILACINFMNLSTAKSEKRMKEIGLRKTVGAHRSQIILQFLGESVLQALAAMLIGVVLLELSLPFFNNLFSRELAFQPFTEPTTALLLFSFALFTGLIAGGYPAIVLSAFHPLHTLKGAATPRGGRFRKVLVIGQFTCSIVLVIATLGIFKQLNFLQSKDLGYNKAQLVYYLSNPEIAGNFAAFKHHLKQSPHILDVTAGRDLPVWSWSAATVLNWHPEDPAAEIVMNRGEVDYDYFRTHQMEIVQGRSFSPDFPSDLNDAVVVNEEAVRQMGFQEPLGKEFLMYGQSWKIIGVVKNFNFDNLRSRINPLVIMLSPEETRIITVRINADNSDQALAYLENTAKSFAPEYPAEYQFLEEDLANLYRPEEITGTAVSWFAGLAVLIAGLGIFGLASHSAERRTREIGVRKVLGASVTNVIMMLSGEFFRLIIIAFLIATPIAYTLLDTWLQEFAYRAEIGIYAFMLAGFFALAIAALAVGYQSVKAAFANPVDALRHE